MDDTPNTDVLAARAREVLAQQPSIEWNGSTFYTPTAAIDAILAFATPESDGAAIPVGEDFGVHSAHCYQGDYEGSCKYGEDDCPAQPNIPSCERCRKPSPQGLRCYACLSGEVEQLRFEADRNEAQCDPQSADSLLLRLASEEDAAIAHHDDPVDRGRCAIIAAEFRRVAKMLSDSHDYALAAISTATAPNVASDTMREAGEQFAENAKNLPGIDPATLARAKAHVAAIAIVNADPIAALAALSVQSPAVEQA